MLPQRLVRGRALSDNRPMSTVHKAARYQEHGQPDRVLEVVDIAPREPKPGQALVDVLAAPINPSDLLMLQGIYPAGPRLPAVGGSEGVGRVVRVEPGEGGSDLAEGQLVVLPGGTPTWQHQVLVPADQLMPVSAGDPLQLAMLAVNPPTARLMLETIVDLEPGDWVIQNAANSGVGNYLIQLAKARGIRTVNVVRRAEVEAELTAMGADAVLVDGDDLGQRVRELTGGGARLGIDAVAGEASLRIAESLADGGTFVNYGALSGKACRLAPAELLFRDITARGFWLVRWLQSATPEARRTMYQELAQHIIDGVLHTAIEKSYPVAEATDAIAHAMQSGRSGKILITPNL